MAIESLDRALDLFGAPLYVYHEIVHNRPVVERFRKRGVVFVDDISEIPEGANVLYSAHGVAPAIRAASEARRLRAIDATCPLVTKVHLEAVRFAQQGYTILLIGHEGHDEVLGTMGEAPANIRLFRNAISYWCSAAAIAPTACASRSWPCHTASRPTSSTASAKSMMPGSRGSI